MSISYFASHSIFRQFVRLASAWMMVVLVGGLMSGCGNGSVSTPNRTIGGEWSGSQQSSSQQSGTIHLSLIQADTSISGTANLNINNTTYQGAVSGSYTITMSEAKFIFNSDYYASYGAVNYTGTVATDGQSMTLRYTRSLSDGTTDDGSATLTKDQPLPSYSDDRNSRKR